MEQPPYLSSIPRYSAFHLPWSGGDRFPHLHPGGHDTECPEHTDLQAQTRASEGLFSRNQTPRQIAMQLLRDSWIIFRDLKLEDWVKYAMGMPSTAISLFESYHNDLGVSLHSFLLRSPHDVDIFWEVAKVFYFPPQNHLPSLRLFPCQAFSAYWVQSVQPIDRFLHCTLSQALTAFDNKGPYHKLPMGAGLITGPLKELLAQPDKAIMRRLKVLEARYARYKIGPDMACGRAFEVRTNFFTTVSEKSAATIAWEMTRDVLQSFGKISLDRLAFHDSHLRHLAVQWDQINHEVEEVATAGGLDGKLRDIASVSRLFVSSLTRTSSQSSGTLSLEKFLLSLRRSKWHGASPIPD